MGLKLSPRRPSPASSTAPVPTSPAEALLKPVLSRCQELLMEFEALQQERSDFVQQHAEVLEKYGALVQHEERIREELRSMLHVQKSPPHGMPLLHSGKTARVAVGDYYYVDVSYSQKAGYYDPALLPEELLLRKGVVSSVSTSRVWEIGGRKYDSAWKQGEWQTPRVHIARIGSENVYAEKHD